MNAPLDNSRLAPEAAIARLGPEAAERRLARIDRLYRALNTTIEAILRARSLDELYQAVCDASVHGAEFLATTVFLHEPGTALLKGVAGTGPFADVAMALSVSSDETLVQGRGLIGTAYRTHQPCVSHDMRADPRLQHVWEISKTTGAQAMAALPLLQGGKTIGVLVYISSTLGEFDGEMMRLLERVGGNVSFALDNFDLEAERQRAEAATRRASRMYAALSATNEAITRTRSMQELFQQVCDASVDGGKYLLAAVLLPDAGGHWLTVAAAAGIGPAIAKLRQVSISVDAGRPEGQGTAGSAFRSGRTHTSRDLQNDERTRPWHAAAKASGMASNAAVPLLRQGHPVGVLLFYSDEKDAFDDGIVKLLERLTENVSFALETFEREAERKAAQERIQFMATHDGLTGLPNRMMFTELLTIALHSARRYRRTFAVLFIDLDRFKFVNDTLGHTAGDELLKEITARFKNALRDSDVVARLGGDEFIVLVQEVGTAEQVTVVARKLLAAAVKPVRLCGQDCQVSASIGIAMYPGSAEDEHSLMKNADTAMYLAKERGKNNYQFYSADIKSSSLDRMSIEAALRQALAGNEFEVHYQAKLDLGANAISGVEALLRWHSPMLGALAPAQFMPVAEQSGLIVPIGRWVLRTACAQNVAWQREGLAPLCMAVNLSARQFLDDGLLADVSQALQESGMAPQWLELEITEGVLMHNPQHAIKQLTAIKQMGVRVAIDDFGTAYAALGHLDHFLIDTLKVDRAFIRGLSCETQGGLVAGNILKMGKALSLTVVAKGVETPEQVDFLRHHACDQMQGYYFSRPLPCGQFSALVRDHAARGAG